MNIKSGYRAIFVFALFILFIFGVFSVSVAEEKSATIMLKSDNGNVYLGDDGKYYISSSQRIYLEAVDRSSSGKGVGVGRIDVKVDDGDFLTYFKSKTDKIFLGQSGEHKISYRVTDRLGNMSNDYSVSIIVDDTNPTAVLEYKVTDPNKQEYKKNNFVYLPGENEVSVTATDTISGLKHLLVSKNSSGYEPMASGSSFVLDERGINLIKLKSADNVMNLSPVSIHSFHIDNAPPIIEIKTKYALIDGEDEKKREREMMGEDNDDMEEVMGEDTREDPMDTPVDENGKPKGKSEGSDGIERALPVEEVGFVFDISMLPGSSEGQNHKYTNTKNVFHFIVSDSDSGLASVEWKLNDAEWSSYDGGPVKLSKGGVNTIEIKAVDFVGNVSSKSLSIIVDDLPPEVNLKISSDKE